MPLFSIIIPVHNRPLFVRQAIDSVRAQSFTDHEIIVVDDASTDDTPDVLRSYGSAIRVTTFTEPHGQEVARHSGVAAACGSYIVFLDSDDLLFPWALDTYHFVVATLPKPALIVSRIAYFSTGLPAMAVEPYGPIELVVFDDYLSRDRSIGSTCSMIVVSRDAYDRVGGCRQSTVATQNMSDHDFLLRIGCQGPAILLERPSTIAYRVHPGSCNKDVRRATNGMLRIIKAERNGIYAGGNARRFDRRASIGGPTLHWSGRALRSGRPWHACRLLLLGLDMVLAKIVQKIRIKHRGLKPVIRFVRTPKEQLPT